MVDVAHRRARVAAVTAQAVMIVQQAAVAVPSVVMIAVMIAVMIGRQSDVDAQLASQPMMVTAGKRDQPVVVVLKVAIVQTAMVLQDVMIVQTVMSDLAVMIGGMIGQIVTRDQIVTAALKDAMTRPAQRVAASHHLVTGQRVATNHHLVISQRAAASRHLVTGQRVAASRHLVISQRVATNHHLVISQRVAASHHLVISQRVAASHLAASPPLTNVRILVINQRRKRPHPSAVMVTQDAHHPPRKSVLAQRGQAAMPHHKAAKAH